MWVGLLIKILRMAKDEYLLYSKTSYEVQTICGIFHHCFSLITFLFCASLVLNSVPCLINQYFRYISNINSMTDHKIFANGHLPLECRNIFLWIRKIAIYLQKEVYKQYLNLAIRHITCFFCTFSLVFSC